MNEVKNTLMGESVNGSYLATETKVIDLLAEGVLCSSVNGIGHDDFTMGDSFDL